ncbi:hypothetical protein [Nocardiopsis baichengensis]|uniref:hypothetical protein n=1 Tax=Nocardiopsis baichengensis TaxID=280240 RepID=UPI000349C7BC|nr:hypothetical protein [Nocardiopsis baichengensis]
MATWIALAVVFLSVSQSVSSSLKPPAVKPVRRFVARAGLPPSYAGPWLARRLYGDESAAAATCAVLILAALGTGLAVPELRHENAWAATIVAAYLLGRAAGAVIPVVRATASRQDGSPRVARPFLPSVDDYVPPAAGWGAAAAGLLPVAALGVLLAFAGTGRVDTAEADWPVLVLLAAAGPVIAAGTALLAGRFIAAPRPAAAPYEFAADDAVRAYRLRALLAASTALCALAAAIVGVLATETVSGAMVIQNPAAVLLMGGTFAAALAYIAAAVAIDLAGPGRRYRDRLWPQGFPAGPAPSPADGGTSGSTGGGTGGTGGTGGGAR